MIKNLHIPKWLAFIILILLSSEIYGQWLSGYTYRESITINGDNVYGSVDLVDFPLLVYLSDSDLRSVNNGGFVFNNNGWDIRFTSDDGTTLLDHEIELYDASGGNLTAWVRIPNLTHDEDTKLYIYFGNQSVIVDPSTSDTWNSEYSGVWHLNENTNDASQYANDGINSGTTSAIGKIGNARSFDGTDDYIRLTTEDLYDNLSQGTVLAWVKWNGTDFETIFGADSGPCEHPFEFAIESGSFKVWADDSGCSGTFIGQSSLINPAEWHQLAYVVSGTDNSMYIDGEKQVPTYGAGSASSTFFFDESSVEATIYELGRSVQDNAEAFSGLIDELRISSTPFSSEWIQTSYENQNDPEAFYEISGIDISNDLPCDALLLDLNGDCSSQVFSNYEASGSGVPLTECVGYSGGDVWFKVEVPVSGNLIVKLESEPTPGWLRQPGLAVYSGTCDNLTHDTCWIDPLFPAPFLMPEFTFSAYTPGDTLFLRVWGYNGSIDKFRICARDPDIEIFNLSGSGSYCEGGAGLAVSLDGSQPGIDYQLKKNGIDHGTPLSGNGSSLLWSDQSEGVYDVVAINITEGLTKRMNGKAIINKNPIPVVTYGYENYKTISINSDSVVSSQDLVNFPLLVSIPGDSDLRTLGNGGYVYNNNGFDIAFTDKDFNPLPFEMISYDPVTGAYAGWVKVPLVSYNMDTDIQMLYGKSGISTDHSSRETWNAEYVQVMHLDENFEDATLSGNYGLNDGSTDAIGKLGSGRSFDGLDDKFIVYDDPALDGTNDEATFSLWINFVDASDGDHQIIFTTENRYSGAGYEWASQGPGDHFFYPNGNDVNNYNMVANPFVDGAWHYLVTTLNFSTREVKFYVDGIPVTLTEENVPVYWSALGDLDNWLWGGNPDRNTRYFYGLMDEIRIQTVVRQEGWFRTEYANQNNPTGFYSISEGNNFEPLTDLCLNVDPFTLPQPKPPGGILSGTGVDGGYFDPGAAGAGDHTITYTYTDGNGCLASGSKEQTVLSVPSPSITGNISLCPNSSGETYSTPAIAGHSYTWVLTGGGASIISGQGTNEIIVDWDTISGTVSVSETNDASGCDSTTADLLISVGDTTSPVFECPADLTENIDLNCEFSIPDYSDLINLSDDCDPDPSYMQSPTQGTVLSGSGTIQEVVLTSNDAHGNESTCSFNLLILDNTPPEAISLSDTSVIIPEGVYQTSIDIPLPVFTDNCGILSVSNDFNGGADASGIYQYGTTTVVYTVTDINNNTETFNQQVHVGFENEPEHGLVIPEAFSPNEDGMNDRFEILGLEQYSENELQVYNVHGIEVFRMADYDNSWDGIAQGKLNDGNKLPTGTYYYVLRLIPGDKLIKGFVYLRRE